MLDVAGSIFAVLLYATLLGVLIPYLSARARPRALLIVGAAAWALLVSIMAALGYLAPGALGPLPANLLPFFGLLAALFLGWRRSPSLRARFDRVPLKLLVALNVGRLGGLFFILLWLDGRLSAPFAPAAGFGDMVTAALALVLALSMAQGASPRWVTWWNAFGALDLLVAVGLGFLSAPGSPFRIFEDGPGTLAMTTLPWAYVPAIFVPIYLFLHFVIALKLRSPRGVASAVAMEAAR